MNAAGPSKAPSSTRSIPEPIASIRHTLRFLLIVSAVAAIGSIQSRHGTTSPTVSRIPLYVSVAGLQLLFVWFIKKGVRPHGHSIMALVGRRWNRASAGFVDVALAVGLVVLLRGCTLTIESVFGRHDARIAFLLPSGPGESILWVALSVVAGTCEEIVYRGYLQRQLWSFSRVLPVAVLLQAFVFAGAHAYQGWRAALITGIYGIGFGAVAAWRRSIIPGAIAHVLVDIVGGLFSR
jgi:uncharacterized protein